MFFFLQYSTWSVILGGNLDLSISMTTISTLKAFGMYEIDPNPQENRKIFNDLTLFFDYDHSISFRRTVKIIRFKFKSQQFAICSLF